MAILRITDSDGTQVRPLEGAMVTIGRGPGNQIILKDLASSSRHAQLIKNGEGWAIEDRGSLNKTFVNGQEIQKIALKPGDRILIGSTELVFELAEAPPLEDTVPVKKPETTPGYAIVVFSVDGGRRLGPCRSATFPADAIAGDRR